MTALTNYLYEASIALAILYLPFIFIGRKNTFHKTNRAILVASLIISVCLPFININVSAASGGQGILQLQEVIITPGNNVVDSSGYSVFSIVLTAYFSISALLLLIDLGKIAAVFIKNRNAKYVKHDDYTMVYTNQESSPFSLFKYLFINKENHSEEDMQIIITHELQHIHHHHYLDNILMEIIRLLFWIHPAVYLFQRSLKNIHEYQADMETVQHTDRSHYLRLLYSETLRPQQIGMANHFSYSPLKRRLKMMLQKPTKKYAGIYYFTWIPVTALLVFFLGTTQVNAQTTKTGEKEVKTSTQDVPPPPPPSYTVKNGEVIRSNKPVKPTESKKEPGVWLVVEEQPYFPGGESERIKFLVENLKYPEEARKDSISGTVYVTFIVEKSGDISNINILKGVHPSIDQEAMRVIELMPPWTPGKTNGEAVRVRFNMPLQFKLK